MKGLESTGHTRTLHAIELPARLCDTGAVELRHALYVDCETTGLSVERDQAIEVALLPFTYAVDDGRIAEVCHDEAQCYLQDPGRPLDAIITDLTGLTDDDLRGRHIDVAAANTLIARSDLIVAHNARFDRPFTEASLGAFIPPTRVTRLLIARDNHIASARAAERLLARCRDRALTAAVITAEGQDFNDDLVKYGRDALGERIRQAPWPGRRH